MGSSSAPVQWAIYESLKQIPDPEQEAAAGKTLYDKYHKTGIGDLHAQLFYNRGFRDPEEMRAFLTGSLETLFDPAGLTDMHLAVPRIQRAIQKREHITVFGDFDADGVTSASLLTRALRRLGQPAERLSAYIPSRLHGPRGMSKEAIAQLHERGTTLIITSDCGTSDVDEVNYAQQELGIDVIITDHHHPPAQLPQALALINNWRPDSTYSERYLCGVGTAFKLAQALYSAAGYPPTEAWDLLDLVAIGTVGDVVPLLGENHILVHEGLKRLNGTKNPGLRALIQVAKPKAGEIRERDISFALAPRINAAGRMKDAKLAFELLTTDNEAQAAALAAELEQLNASRQLQTEDLMKLVREQARQQADKQVILVKGAKEQWPEGIIGLVAGKLAEETGRPVFVLSQDEEVSRGSARGPEHFNIILALQAARPQLFERFGGHAQAAGFTIANLHIDELLEHLLGWRGEAQNGLAPALIAAASASAEPVEINNLASEPDPAPANRKVDLVISKPERINYDMLQKINQLSPFGAGNPEPVFQLNNVLIQDFWTIGPEGRHLRMRLIAHNQPFEGTFLRGGARAATLKLASSVHIIFSLEQAWSKYGESSKKVSLKILDILPQQ
ncbi:MAG TPA: single-stranded-DNA-specific exonuclease RecJ [Ktedonobacteraceae bacterium]